MGTLEDQLKKWRQQQPNETKAGKSLAKAPPEPARRSPTKREPFPKQTLRREDGPPASAAAPSGPPPSDAELFQRALAGVGEDVVLQKFDVAGAVAGAGVRGRGGSTPAAPPPSDEELFLRFVGDSRAVDGGRGAAPGVAAKTDPKLRLSLRGVGGDAAARRLRAFLDDAVRAGEAIVLIEIDAGADGVLDAARGHPAVAAVRDAPAHLGGKHARVVRLKSGR